MKTKRHTFIGNVGQWLSVLVMSYGIYRMISGGLDEGTIVFTLGCLVETLSTKIKYYGDEYIKRIKGIRDATKTGNTSECDEEKLAVVDSFLYIQYF